MIRKNPVLALTLLVTISLAISVVAPRVLAHGTVDQAWAPGASAAGGDAIQFHSPIGQTFTPTLDNLVAVDVNLLNSAKLDQQDTNVVSWDGINSHMPIGQYFKPDYPLFTGFEVYLENTAGADRTLTMNLRFGMIAGPIQGSKSFTIAGPGAAGWVHVDMNSPITVIPGDSYILELVDATGGVRWYADTTDSYPDGTRVRDGALAPGVDYNFKTYGVTNSVAANIRSGSIAGPILGSATASISVQPFSWIHIDFGSAISLTPGATYVLELTVPYDSGSWGVSIPGGYAGGTAIFNGVLHATGDNWFRTYGIAAPSPDFSISSSTVLISVVQGGGGSATITVASLNAFNSPVTLVGSWVGTAPSGVNFVLTSPITPPSGSTATSPLSVTADPTASTGSFTLRVTGTSGALSHSVDLTIQVSASATTSATTSSTTSVAGPDFTIGASPSSLTVTQGGTGTSNVNIGSTNGFSAAVTLTYSWVGTAPSGVSITLPGPVTPPSGGTATSTLSVGTGSSASTGTFTLSVTGTSGSLTHSTNVGVQIVASGATSATTTTPVGPSCLIATASYGSELSPEVQLLRGFRDNSILRTSSGSAFMIAFNAWYYSFSPNVANYLTEHAVERTIMKGALYPLVAILFVSSSVFSATSAFPEFSALLSGLLASAFIGAFYLGLPLSLIRAKIRRLGGWKMQKALEKILSLSLSIGIAGIILGESLAFTPMLIVSTSVTILGALFLAAWTTSAALSKLLMRRGRRTL